MKVLHLFFILTILGVHGVETGSEATAESNGHTTQQESQVQEQHVEQQQQESQVQEQHVEQSQQDTQSKDYLYLDIGNKGSNYEAYVQGKTADKQRVGDDSNIKTITVTDVTSGAEDAGVNAQIPDGYKGYQHKLGAFYKGAKTEINKALKPGDDLGDSSGQQDPTLQLRLQVAGQDLTLPGQDSTAGEPPKYGQTQSSDESQNDPVVYFYQGSGSAGSGTPDTVPLLFKFGGKYYGPSSRAKYFQGWNEITIEGGADGQTLKQNLKHKLDEINRQLNEIDLTQTGSVGTTTEYGLPDPSSGVPLTGGFQTKRITVTREEKVVSSSTTYTTVSHRTTNDYNIGSISGLGNGSLDNLHTTKLADVSHNEAIAVYTSVTTGSLQTPQLLFVCSSASSLGSGKSTVHGYYDLRSASASTNKTFTKLAQACTLDQLTTKDPVTATCAELVTILETLGIVAAQGSAGPAGPSGSRGETGGQGVPGLGSVGHVGAGSELHTQEAQQLTSQLKDYLYLEINSTAEYQPSVQHHNGEQQQVRGTGDGSDGGTDVKKITVTDAGSGAQVPNGYKVYKHGLATFYTTNKTQIKAALKKSPTEAQVTDSGDNPELQLRLQIGGRVLEVVGTNGNALTNPLQYGNAQAIETNDPVIYFYGTGGGSTGSETDIVPLLLKFGGKYYGPTDKATYFTTWREYTFEGGSDSIKTHLDSINRTLNEVDLSKKGDTGVSQGYGLETAGITNVTGFNTKRIAVNKQEKSGNGGKRYTLIAHKTTNNYNIGNIGGLGDSCTFDNKHPEKLTTQIHNEAIAVYAITGDSTSLGTPSLVLIADSRGSLTDQTSTIHGYYELSSGRGTSDNQYEFKKPTTTFTLAQLGTRDTVQTNCPELVPLLETLGIVAPQSTRSDQEPGSNSGLGGQVDSQGRQIGNVNPGSHGTQETLTIPGGGGAGAGVGSDLGGRGATGPVGTAGKV